MKPSAELRAASDILIEQGIIELEERQYVRCANREDIDDFRYVLNRDCQGRIYIEDGLDLHGDDYKCPNCDRPIFPSKKKRYDEWRVSLLLNGIKAFVEAALNDAGFTYKEKAPWVFRVDVGDEEVWLCIVDFCESCQHMTREWAMANKNKALWLVVHPRGKAERFLQEEWVQVVSLSELLTGESSLNSLLRARAACQPETNLGNPSLPIYTKDRKHPATFETEMSPNPDRLFVVQITDGTVLVNGRSVIPKQAITGYPIFAILLKHHLQGMIESLPSGEYLPLSTRDICDELYNVTGKEFDDEDAIRKTINRIQNNIEKVIKRETGAPIDRCDIIETVRWKGQGEGDHGYRLNPSSLAIRPFIPPKSET